MKNLNFFCLIIVLMFSTFCVSAQLCSRNRVWNVYHRSSIEKLPAKQRISFLRFLNEGRIVADESMKLLFQGKYELFYKSASKDLKNNCTQQDFIQLFEKLEKSAGKIFFYEYRNQDIQVPYNSYLPEAFTKAVTNTTYAVRTTKIPGELFIDVETTIEDGKHKFSFINTNNYGDNIPPWLIKPSTSKTQKKNN